MHVMKDATVSGTARQPVINHFLKKGVKRRKNSPADLRIDSTSPCRIEMSAADFQIENSTIQQRIPGGTDVFC